MFKRKAEDNRLRFGALFFLLLALWIVVRLFVLQVIQHDYYALFALNSHEIYEKLHPHRGTIYFQDTRTKERFPAAVNRDYYLVYAVPREISAADLVSTTNRLSELLGVNDPNQKQALFAKLASSTSGYAQVAKKISDADVAKIKAALVPGIYFTPEEYRYYPENNLAAPILGFVGFDDTNGLTGRYGLEGYWDKQIAGQGGFSSGERGALGGWISLADRKLQAPENGPDLVLTIDRTLEFKACERLAQGLTEYQAKSASLVLMNPKTGAILAMCSLPDFDPNNYSKVDNLSVFNNTTIFSPYEPGSVFKAITMGAGLDLGVITPNTTYTDPCVLVINGYHVRNAQQMCYGAQTMTEVLEKSINTGAVWAEEKIGGARFYDYVQKFGFGQKTGITLASEAAGDINSLARPGQIFGANGSFGQGFTATPLQLTAAYAAIANGGKLLKPYIVDEVDYANGRKEKTVPESAGQVVTPRTAELLTGMLVSVVENHYHAAKIAGFYVAGKTGTAQIPENGKYSAERTNHTFAGFGPVGDPRFVLLVKYEEPQRKWAEQTALPVFRDVLQFAFEYYGIAGKR